MSSSSVLGITDYVIIGLMLAVSSSVGLYFRFTGGKQRTTREFLMADRKMALTPVSFSLMATFSSATSIIGETAEVYMYGSQYIMWCTALPVCGCIIAYGFLPVFIDMELSTAYEYLERRFGKTTRTIASALFILQMIFYVAVVLYAPSLALSAVTDLSVWTSVITLASVVTFYCSLGGLKAVLWTDVFQAILMYVTVVAVFTKAAIDHGSIGELFRVANDGGRLVLFNMNPSLTERYTFWSALGNGVVRVLYTFGASQSQIQRLLSVGDLKKSQRALFWSLPFVFIFTAFCGLNGIALYSIYHDCDPLLQPGKKLKSGDQLVPYTILKMFGSIPGLSGLCIAGIFSASLSTASSALNSVTTVLMEDFIRPFCFRNRLTDSRAACLAKIIAIVLGLLCLLFIFIVANFRGILEASSILSGMVRGPVLGIYVLGMFTMTANEPGMLIGVIAGFTINAWMGFGYRAAKIKIPTLTRSTAGCAAVTNITSYLTTMSPNKTTLFEIESVTDELSLTGREEKYVFPLYRVSYLLFQVISFIIALLVGYLASRIIGIWKKYPVVDSKCLSPFVRKWYLGDSQAISTEKMHHAVELKSISNEVTHHDIGSDTTAASEA